MDALASQIMDAYSTAEPFRSTIGMPTVHYCKIAMTGNIHSSLYCHLMRQPVKTYLESSYIIGLGTYDSIAWEVINKARGLRHNLDMQISKLICNQLPTLQTLSRQKQVISDKCPFCKTMVEHKQHIYRCAHVVCQDQWREELQKVALWLQNQHSEPGIRQMLIMMLNQWHKNPDPNHYHHLDKILNVLTEDQHEIGWYALLQGFIAHSIVDAQHRHFQYIGLLRSDKVWVTGFCRQL